MKTVMNRNGNLIIILGIYLFIGGTVSYSQQWTGNNNTTDPIRRTGNVGIGTSADPIATLELNGSYRLDNSAGTAIEIRIQPTGTADQIRVAIQNALNSCAVSGGVVHLSSIPGQGSYLVSQVSGQTYCLLIPNGVTLTGDGRYQSCIQPNSSVALSVIQMQGNCKLSNLSIIESSGAPRSPGQIAVSCPSNDCFIENVSITKYDVGVQYSLWSGEIRNSEISLCNTGVNISNTGDANNIIIYGCRIMDYYQYGVQIRGIGNRVLNSNIYIDGAYWNGTTASLRSTGIRILAANPNFNSNKNVISGNFMEGNYVHVSLEGNGNNVINNFFERPASWSQAYAFVNGSNNTASGNVIIGNAVLQNYAPVGFNYTDYMLSGQIGVGTTAPGAQMDVHKSGQSLDLTSMVSGDNGYIAVNPNPLGGNWNSLVQAGDKLLLYSGNGIETGTLVIGPWSATAKGLRMNSKGFVGIGISSPDTTLHVNGAIALGSAGGPKIMSGANAPTITAANGSLYLRTGGTGPNLYVRQNGAWISK